MMYALRDKVDVSRSKLLDFNKQRRADRAAAKARNESTVITLAEAIEIQDKLEQILSRPNAKALTTIIRGFQSSEGIANPAGPLVILDLLSFS